MNKRAREIISWIMKERDYQETCTINDLMDKLKVSERTIRYDLEEITDSPLENKRKPIQLCEYGVIELQKDTDAIRMLLGQNDFYSFKLSKEERMHMILYLIADTGEYVTLQQPVDILSVFRSTIIHDMDDVYKSTQKQDLETVSLRRGLRIQGRESSRRITLTHLLRPPHVQQYRTLEHKGMMSPQDSESLKRMTKSAEISDSRSLTDSSSEDLWQYLMLMIERYHKHWFVEIDYVPQYLSTQKIANHLMDKMEGYLGMEYRLQEEYPLVDILYNMHYPKRNDADGKIMQIQVIPKQFIDVVAHDLNTDLRDDFQFYQSLTNHLQSTFKDLSVGYGSDNELLHKIVKKSPKVVATTEKSLQPLELFVQRAITREEIAYTTIHVCVAMKCNRYQGARFTILPVCSSGMGTLQLLLSRLKKYLQFYVADALPVHVLANYDVMGIDLIISTVPLKEKRCEIIILHSYLSDEDCILLGEKLETLKSGMHCVNSSLNFQRLQTLTANSIATSPLDKDGIYRNIIRDLQSCFFSIASNDKATPCELLAGHIEADVECVDWKEAVRRNVQPLLEQDYLSEQYITQVIRNVEVMGPYIVLAQGFASPHESLDVDGRKLGMQLIRLKHPVLLHSQLYDPADFIYCLSAIDKDSHLKVIFHLMNSLSKADFCENIRKAKTAEEVYQIIYEYESIL